MTDQKFLGIVGIKRAQTCFLSTFNFFLILIIFYLFSIDSYSQNSLNDPSIYYPLNVGNLWEYEALGGKGTKRVEVLEYSDKHNSYMVSTISKTGDFPPLTTKEIVEIRGAKALILASQAAFGGEFTWYSPAKILLEFPIEIGKAWVKQEISKESMQAQESCKVIDILSNYKVKGGEFKDVVKINCVLKMKAKNLPPEITTDYYYASKIGLIKEEMKNAKAPLAELTGYKIR